MCFQAPSAEHVGTRPAVMYLDCVFWVIGEQKWMHVGFWWGSVEGMTYGAGKVWGKEERGGMCGEKV